MNGSLSAGSLVSSAEVEPTGVGRLNGLAFVVKDVFDLVGHPTGMGNPTWFADAPVASRSAAAVDRLLVEGARCVGKAVTDELAFSVSGVNAHYGAPPNPWAPDRTAGGSSSGSASAVAFGGVPFALGTDTAGSIRVPASYCGLVGVRPTHATVDTAGLAPLAPSFDTVGWLARSAALARQVGEVLLADEAGPVEPVTELVVLNEAFADLDPGVGAHLGPAARRMASALDLPVRTASLGPSALGTALDAFRTIQGAEVWSNDGAWAEAHSGALHPDIERRLAATRWIDRAAVDEASTLRRLLVEALDAVVGRTGAIVLPSTPGWAPLLTELVGPDADVLRARVLRLTCVASLWGAPAVSLPVRSGTRLPVGLGVVAAPGRDRALLDLAVRAEAEGELNPPWVRT